MILILHIEHHVNVPDELCNFMTNLEIYHLCPIGIPVLTLDKNPTNNQKPTWTWDAIPSANDYELILDGVIIEHTYSSTSYQPSSDLPKENIHLKFVQELEKIIVYLHTKL